MDRTILTDLGNVVAFFDYKRVAQNFHRLLTDAHARSVEDVLAEITGPRGSALLEEFETGQANHDAYRTALTELLGLRPEVDASIFWNCHADMFTNNQPVIELWQRACAVDTKLRLIACSDCDPVRLHHVRLQTGLLFHRVVTSFNVYARKPDPKMFHKALRVSECEPSSIFYADDRLENVEAGTAHGFVSHRYDPADPQRDMSLTQALNKFLAST